MRVGIVFPPSLCLPNAVYSALPLLNGALRRDGHQTAMFDLNLAAADRLLTEGVIERTLALGRLTAGRLEREPARRLTATLDAIEPSLRGTPRAKALLRDPERFFDKPAFRDAFWGVVENLGFLYQLDPVLSPHDAEFGARLRGRLAEDPWSPLRDLHHEGLLDPIAAFAPDLIAVCLAFPEQSFETMRLARDLRQRLPDTFLALGGPLVSQLPGSFFAADGGFDSLSFFDAVCIGDGVETISALADRLSTSSDLDRIPNLAYRRRDGSVVRPESVVLDDLDRIPLPSFLGAESTPPFSPRPIYPLMTSRGCYYGKCTFCSIGWRENYRSASEPTIGALVDALASIGARWVQLQDSSLPPKNARRLAHAIESRGHEIRWVAGMKFDDSLLDPGFAEDLHRGGCRSLMLGFESGSQRVLDRMVKGFQVSRVPRMLANLRRVGISAELLWFLGFPGESHAELLETLRFLGDHKRDYGLAAFVSEYRLHPDTVVYSDPRKFGVTIRSERDGSCVYDTDSGITPDEAVLLKATVAGTNHRTLVCNGSHLPHLAERGVDLAGLERPFTVPSDALAYCAESNRREVGALRSAFYDEDFGFRSLLERRVDDVAAEFRALPAELRHAWPEDSAYRGAWTVLGLFVAGRRLEENCARCPRTAALVARVPGLFTAGFSILGANTTLPIHRGLRGDLLRCHLAIDIPEDCALLVNGETRRWEYGRTLVFDDTMPHAAWNRGAREKVILLIDFAPSGDAGTTGADRRDRSHYDRLFPDWAGDGRPPEAKAKTKEA